MSARPAPAIRPPRVDVYTNAVAGGWHPRDLEAFLGGSEESLVLWSRALAAAGVDVTVYYSPPPAADAALEDGGVRWLPRGAFAPHAARDVLITFKDPRPWLLGADARLRIHWSAEIELPWPAALRERLTDWVCLSRYHAARMAWLPPGQVRIIPLGFDRAGLLAARRGKVPGRALYCSSPDRGLERLLLDWPLLRERHPGLELHVCYGWQVFDACAAGAAPHRRHAAGRYRERIRALLRQPGIVNRGALPRAEMAAAYWEAQYWMLPLAHPDAELFCLNALKARCAGAVPVVLRRGALEETVERWHPYDRFAVTPAAALGAPLTGIAPGTPALPWEDVVAQYWLPLLQGGT
jgi:glycosyltransferase involved in cell wall biosynthesis